MSQRQSEVIININDQGGIHLCLHLSALSPQYHVNKPVPGAKEFYPLNEPSIGNPLSPVRLGFECAS
ncbi:hypothetical protein B0F90DRAFT_1719659 [Multifurca ochricompacta]|uniref:Uncharacterized protein n=1 Tax=Multifurca ochricompacta TaxID=376703 RepID=A0AAD4QNQ7_9AGAM|nr:hypothetical protein B0F90DRAFT_1719659 [Multifurca ochricompacta]